jgi:hypothetical protein
VTRMYRTCGAQNAVLTVPSLARLGYVVSRLRRSAFVVFDLGSFHRNSPLLIGNSCLVVSDCGLHRWDRHSCLSSVLAKPMLSVRRIVGHDAAHTNQTGKSACPTNSSELTPEVRTSARKPLVGANYDWQFHICELQGSAGGAKHCSPVRKHWVPCIAGS